MYIRCKTLGDPSDTHKICHEICQVSTSCGSKDPTDWHHPGGEKRVERVDTPTNRCIVYIHIQSYIYIITFVYVTSVLLLYLWLYTLHDFVFLYDYIYIVCVCVMCVLYIADIYMFCGWYRSVHKAESWRMLLYLYNYICLTIGELQIQVGSICYWMQAWLCWILIVLVSGSSSCSSQAEWKWDRKTQSWFYGCCV